jgi:GDPmannose 4,6-dehydratase
VLVTGVSGQDGYFLAQRLLAEGHEVHGIVRDRGRAAGLPRHGTEADRFIAHEMDLRDPVGLAPLIRRLQPDEVYSLAGQSSVSASFHDPETTWKTNVGPVLTLLEAIRNHSPHTRMYQASSSEMFGSIPGGDIVHNELSPLRPLSPYAAAKAAAHVACAAYRASYDLRVACGILFNHESSRRSADFLSRKVVDHVKALRDDDGGRTRPLLRIGNLHVQRDWGFAPDFVDGILLIARQVKVRSAMRGRPEELDVGATYRDYVLGTGRLHAVWELVDRAFHIGGFELRWARDSMDPGDWVAHFADTGDLAVDVDPVLRRAADPVAIEADPSRARTELGWSPQVGLDPFLREMLDSGT